VFIILNELLHQEKYFKCLDVFDVFVKSILTLLESDGDTRMKRYMASLSKNQMQLIPFGHFRIIAECLLAINTKDSYRLIEPLLFHTAAKCNSFLNNMSIACFFLLELNQVILPINDLNYQKKNKKTKQRLLFFFLSRIN